MLHDSHFHLLKINFPNSQTSKSLYTVNYNILTEVTRVFESLIGAKLAIIIC